jgi:hypothetical protein
MNMPKFSAAALLAAALASAAMPTAQAQRRVDLTAAKLPDGDGKSEVIAYCAGACHPAARFVNMRQSPAEWDKTVMLMVAFGAQLFPEDVATITKYLDTYLSDHPVPRRSESK